MHEGIYLIDKPQSWTSHDVVAKIRRLSGVKRVGHAGTLDPLATGLLIVLVGREFTKRQSEFLKLDKEYECAAQLGLTTDTYDIAGKILRKADAEDMHRITEEKLKEVIATFVGSISQTVPAYSAVKVEGRKLYARAREGQQLAELLPTKEVTIHRLQLTHFERSTGAFSFEIHCSSGTYIRSLVHDIGQQLGVGATVTALRRTKIGEFSVADATSLVF